MDLRAEGLNDGRRVESWRRPLVKPKQLVSTGKVIWIEIDGESSSPLRFVLEDDGVYFLRNGKFERLPDISDGRTVKVIGHPLSQQTQAGSGDARVTFVSGEEVPDSVLLELAGTMYDPSLGPEDNVAKLRSLMKVARLDLV